MFRSPNPNHAPLIFTPRHSLGPPYQISPRPDPLYTNLRFSAVLWRRLIHWVSLISDFNHLEKMRVSVVTRSGRELFKGGLELNDSATVADLQEAIHQRRSF
ncbi:uncharacterized protein LOC131320374 isoform X2 [Rhododendron vialii]|uniref:uncharacterized protein LOC131320374 isoform X2 n=1 Tax=Rhododendron vialii TaxID=182163 RepID=UPI00265D7FB8|nr:uncharacterized protein LOC131320374 isoform X2 [Rhododendron vialii]